VPDLKTVIPNVNLPSTYAFTAATTNTTLRSSNVVFSLPRSATAVIAQTIKLQGAGSSAVVTSWDSSIDGSKWVLDEFTVSTTADTTNAVTSFGALTIGPRLFLRLGGYQNPNATAVTNMSINAMGKIGL
jgi:hypothetical protein